MTEQEKYFCLKCLDYDRTEASWLFDEIWDLIQKIESIEFCENVEKYVPVGMLRFRFNQKWDNLKNSPLTN